MPSSYRIDPEHAFAHVRFYGVVTGPDLVSAMTGVFADPAWVPGGVVLWDNRGVQYLALEPQDVTRVAKLAEGLDASRGPRRTAILVWREDGEDIARLFERRTRPASGEHNETRIFRDTPTAAAWLGLCDSALAAEPEEPVLA